jgi:hypothetical protein
MLLLCKISSTSSLPPSQRPYHGLINPEGFAPISYHIPLNDSALPTLGSMLFLDYAKQALIPGLYTYLLCLSFARQTLASLLFRYWLKCHLI